jgi:hypothetical protein
MENPKMSKKVAGYFAKKGNKALASHEYREAAGKEKDTPAIAKREMKALKGAPAGMKNYEKKEHKAMGMKKGGMASCYAEGGMVKKPYKPTPGDLNEKSGGDQEFAEREYQRRKATPKPPAPKPKMYAAGGMVKADGCASKGKTRGRFV